MIKAVGISEIILKKYFPRSYKFITKTAENKLKCDQRKLWMTGVLYQKEGETGLTASEKAFYLEQKLNLELVDKELARGIELTVNDLGKNSKIQIGMCQCQILVNG